MSHHPQIAFHTVVLATCTALWACSSATSGSTGSLTPTDLLDRGIDVFGVVADMPNRQYLGESSTAGAGRGTVYEWQAEHTLLERGSPAVQISVEDLQLAGLPVLDEDVGLDFTGGMYRDVRYRLGGVMNRISISGHFDVRVTVDWQLYDTESGTMVLTTASDGFARGQNLGLTGIQPNALKDAFESCLGNLVGQPEFAAIVAPEGAPG